MKKSSYIIVLITLLLAFLLSGCNQELNQKIDENEEYIKESTEELAIRFLNKLYNIEDSLEYEYIYNLRAEGNMTYLGYKEICSEHALDNALRWHGTFRVSAIDNKFKTSINSLEFSNYYFNEADGTILNEFKTVGYTYVIELLVEYDDGNTEIITIDGGINAKYIEDEWKVYAFKEVVYHKLWLE